MKILAVYQNGGIKLPTHENTIVYSSKDIFSKIKLNETYTLSFKAKSISGSTVLSCDIYPDTYGNSINLPNDVGVQVTTTEKSFSFSGLIINPDSSISTAVLRFWRLPRNPNYEIQVWDIKLEKGNRATDWTPAPEDIDTAISKTVKQVDVEYYLSTSSTECSRSTMILRLLSQVQVMLQADSAEISLAWYSV